MAVDTERRAKKFASRLGRSLLLQPVTDAMSFHSPTHNSAENSARGTNSSSLQSPGDHISSFKPTVTGRESGNHHSSNKMRRSSKGKVPGELRRSTSTPHMRNLALGNADELSPTSNKPRNKLGYHRTSVACGHCRRRKIRCLLAPDDPQGRCANCIRLKKECNFHPVEHNPDEAPSHSVSAEDTTPGLPLTPADSSPRHLSSFSGENLVEFRAPYRGTCSSTPNPSYGFQGDSELDSNHRPSSSRMPVQQPTYPFPHPIDTQWPTATTFLPSSTIAESPSSSTSYWRQSPSTANSAYGSESNVSGGHTPATMSTSSTMSFGHTDQHSWSAQSQFQPPTRSMSYGNIEGLSQPYPGQGLGIQHPDFARRNSPYPYPTSIDTTPAAMHATTISGSTSAPLSAPVVPTQYYAPTWNAFEGVQSQAQPMQMPGRSMSVQWYSEPGHLDRVQEEGPPPVVYNPQAMQQFYSGA